MRDALQGVALAFAIALGSVVIAVALHMTLGVSIVPWATILATIALVVVRVRAPRRAGGAAIGLALSLGSALALFGAWTLAEPLATSGARCGTTDIGVPFAVLLVMFTGAALALPMTLAARVLGRSVLVLATVLVACGSLFAAAGVRALSRPPPDAYLSLFHGEALVLGGAVDAGMATITYAGKDDRCVVNVNGDEHAFRASRCPPSLDVRSDAATGLVLFFDGRRDPVVIAETTGFTPDAIETSALRNRLGPPRAWIAGSLAAMAFAWLALALAFASRQKRMEAIHDGAGWVRISGIPRFFAELATRPAGPVFVVPRDATRLATYRDDGGAKVFTVANRAHVATWAHVAIALVVLASAPLWIARVYGLL